MKPKLDIGNTSELFERTNQSGTPSMTKTPTICAGSKGDGQSIRRESFSTIMKEKGKMAATFKSVARTDKFLPNVIQTAHNSTMPSFTASLSFAKHKSFNQTPKPEAVSVIDKMIAEPEENDFSGYMKIHTDLVSQTPVNSSKIDFQVRSPAVIKARNQRPKLEEVLEEEMTPLQMSLTPEKIRHDQAKDRGQIAKGPGAESKTIYLNLHKEELERGVFMSSNKNPILTLNQYTQGPNPLPFSHFRQTGQILQESLARKQRRSSRSYQTPHH